jgi:hypothetical protein
MFPLDPRNPDETSALEQFAQAQAAWSTAVEAHRRAPPDAGFSTRLAALARACELEAEACRASDQAGYECPRHRARESNQPWELLPESARRGPTDLWRAFDVAVSVFGACGCAGTTTSLVDVAAAFDHLGDAAAALAKAIEAEDRRTGTAPADPRRSTVRLARLAAPVPSNRCPL